MWCFYPGARRQPGRGSLHLRQHTVGNAVSRSAPQVPLPLAPKAGIQAQARASLACQRLLLPRHLLSFSTAPARSSRAPGQTNMLVLCRSSSSSNLRHEALRGNSFRGFNPHRREHTPHCQSVLLVITWSTWSAWAAGAACPCRFCEAGHGACYRPGTLHRGPAAGEEAVGAERLLPLPDAVPPDG